MPESYLDISMHAFPGDAVADPQKVFAALSALEQKLVSLERRLDRQEEYQQEQNESS